MSKLKELTWANHQKAERTEHARKLLKGMTPKNIIVICTINMYNMLL
jgi:hypothetical protein